MWRVTIAAAAALMILSACSSGGDNAGAETTPPEATTSTTVDVTAPLEPIPMPTWCTPASAEDIQTVETALTGTGNKLVDAFATDLSGHRYVMANVDRADGQRLTSADLWVIDPTPGPLGALYAGTSSAAEYSSVPDAGNLPDADPGNATVSAMTDCLTASAQQRNSGS